MGKGRCKIRIRVEDSGQFFPRRHHPFREHAFSHQNHRKDSCTDAELEQTAPLRRAKGHRPAFSVGHCTAACVPAPAPAAIDPLLICHALHMAAPFLRTGLSLSYADRLGSILSGIIMDNTSAAKQIPKDAPGYPATRWRPWPVLLLPRYRRFLRVRKDSGSLPSGKHSRSKTR